MKAKVKSKRMIIIFTSIGVFFIINFLLMFGIKNRFTVYQDPTAGFSVMHPPAWEVKSEVAGAAAVIISPKDNEIDTYFENVTIVIQDVVAIYGRSLSFEEYSQMAIKQMEAVFEGSMDVIEVGEFKLRGRRAYKYVFQGKGHEVLIKNKAVWFLQGDMAYQLFFTALESSYDQYSGRAERIINSFKLY